MHDALLTLVTAIVTAITAITTITPITLYKDSALTSNNRYPLSLPPQNSLTSSCLALNDVSRLRFAPVKTSTPSSDVKERILKKKGRKGFKISRIRGFYTRKVRFSQETSTLIAVLLLSDAADAVQSPRRLAASSRRSPGSTRFTPFTRIFCTLSTMPTISELRWASCQPPST